MSAAAITAHSPAAFLCGHRPVLRPCCPHRDFTAHSENITTVSGLLFLFEVWLFLGPLFSMSILETGLLASTETQIRGCQIPRDKAVPNFCYQKSLLSYEGAAAWPAGCAGHIPDSWAPRWVYFPRTWLAV